MSFEMKSESFSYDNNDNMASMNRKFAKTCVEKKRRDRINRCLDELKDLMSQADDKAKYQKMEKAEILEMAVVFMKNQRSNNSNNTENNTENNTNMAQYYNLAYRQCLNEFQNYLQILPGLKDDCKSKIMGHMTQRYVEMASNNNNMSRNISENNSKSTSIRKSQSVRYSPYSQTPRKNMSVITNDQNSFSSSYNSSSSSCSSLDGFLANNTNINQHSPVNFNESASLSGASSPSLSQCSSPLSCSNKNDNPTLNLSSEENVWRPW